ncbi:MAG TPA: hypothetical protein VGJ77_08425 [Gaiellaceae bacterium]
MGCSSALLLPAAAGAHLSLTPKSVTVGEDVDLVFAVPNEDDAQGVVRVTIGAPREFELDDGEAKPGWTQTRAGQAITWSGDRIPKGQFARFGVRGTAPERPGAVLFNVLVGSHDGKTTTYRVALPVRAHASRDVGARTLGKVALSVAIGAAGLALAAGFLALYVWLRPPPP